MRSFPGGPVVNARGRLHARRLPPFSLTVCPRLVCTLTLVPARGPRPGPDGGIR